MKLEMFSIFDTKANAFLQPFFTANIPTAIRSVQDHLAEDSPIARHVEDYSLFHIGAFDQETGTLSPLSTPINIAPLITLRPGGGEGNGSVIQADTHRKQIYSLPPYGEHENADDYLAATKGE